MEGAILCSWVAPDLLGVHTAFLGKYWVWGIWENEGEIERKRLGDKRQLQIPKRPPGEQKEAQLELTQVFWVVTGPSLLATGVFQKGGAGDWGLLAASPTTVAGPLVTLKTIAPSP